MRRLDLAVTLGLSLGATTGCFLPAYGASARRTAELLNTSDDLRLLLDEWERSGSSINHRTCRPIARMAAFCRVAIVRSLRLLHFVILATAESPRGRHFFGRRCAHCSRSGRLLVAGRGLRRYIGDSVAPCPSHF